jgi:hypothetical protein
VCDCVCICVVPSQGKKGRPVIARLTTSVLRYGTETGAPQTGGVSTSLGQALRAVELVGAEVDGCFASLLAEVVGVSAGNLALGWPRLADDAAVRPIFPLCRTVGM